MRARGRFSRSEALQVDDGAALDVPQPFGGELGQMLKQGSQVGRPARERMAGGEVVRGLQPAGQGLGPVEVEDRPAPRFGIEAVGEASLDAGGLVEEGKRVPGPGEVGRHALGILTGLKLDAGERGPHCLGLDHTGRLAVHIEKVIGKAVAGFERELADRDPSGRMDDGPGGILDDPPGGLESRVDGLACVFLRFFHMVYTDRIIYQGAV